MFNHTRASGQAVQHTNANGGTTHTRPSTGTREASTARSTSQSTLQRCLRPTPSSPRHCVTTDPTQPLSDPRRATSEVRGWPCQEAAGRSSTSHRRKNQPRLLPAVRGTTVLAGPNHGTTSAALLTREGLLRSSSPTTQTTAWWPQTRVRAVGKPYAGTAPRGGVEQMRAPTSPSCVGG